MRFVAFFLVAFVFADSNPGHRARAHPSDALKKYDNKVLIGREIELTERPLSTIVEYFDFSEIKTLQYPPEVLNDYVLDSEAFYALPKTVQEKLSEGLFDLKKPTILLSGKNDSSINREGLVDKDGKPLSSELKKIEKNELIQPKLIVSPKSQGQVPKISNDLVSYNWQELNRRWNALPIWERRDLVDYKYLPRMKLAQILLADASRKRRYDKAKTLPQEFFKNGVDISMSGGALEFRDLKPYSSVSEWYRDVEAFSKRTGIWSGIRDQNVYQSWLDSSIHFHVSVPDLPESEDKNFSALAKEFKKLLVLQGLQEGQIDLLSDRGDVVYTTGLKTKSALRLVARNRIEFRLHEKPLEQELEYFLKHMTASDLSKSLAQVRWDVRKQFNPKIVASILKYAQEEVANEFLEKTRYQNLLNAVFNSKGLTVTELEKEVIASANRVGLDSSHIWNPKSGFQRGMIYAPDATSEANIRNTVQMLLSHDLSTQETDFIRKNSHKFNKNAEVAGLLVSEFNKIDKTKSPKALARWELIVSTIAPHDEQVALKYIELIDGKFKGWDVRTTNTLKMMNPKWPSVVDQLVEKFKLPIQHALPSILETLGSSGAYTDKLRDWLYANIENPSYRNDILDALVRLDAPPSEKIRQATQNAWKEWVPRPNDERSIMSGLAALKSIKKYYLKEEEYISELMRALKKVNSQYSDTFLLSLVEVLAHSGNEQAHLALVEKMTESPLLRDWIARELAREALSEKVIAKLCEMVFDERRLDSKTGATLLTQAYPKSVILNRELMKNFNSEMNSVRRERAFTIVSSFKEIDESIALQAAETIKRGHDDPYYPVAKRLLTRHKPLYETVLQKLETVENLDSELKDYVKHFKPIEKPSSTCGQSVRRQLQLMFSNP